MDRTNASEILPDDGNQAEGGGAEVSIRCEVRGWNRSHHREIDWEQEIWRRAASMLAQRERIHEE